MAHHCQLQENLRLSNPVDEPPAIEIRNGYKTFKKENDPVLVNFSMTIKKGTVYALLGSSGCGKTTVLSSLLGFTKLDKGQIFIHGQEIPKSNCALGYMSQGVSLYKELSVFETLVYFGTLFGADSTNLHEKINLYSKLFSLPDKYSFVGQLSGGEQRRVSLAIALIHNPELIILDEPSSGLDPLIRVKIWQHLKSLAEVHHITILLTTHYTDEAKYADVIGVMRDGCLIAEESPVSLLNRYGTLSLDMVTLQLCKEQVIRRNTLPKIVSYAGHHGSYQRSQRNVKMGSKCSIQRVKTLVWKNWITMFRNLALLCFVTIMPAVISVITCTTFRHDPSNIPIAVVNYDAFENNCNELNKTCLGGPLSCKFLNALHSSKGIHGIPFVSMETAKSSVQAGDTFGVLEFPRNFSEALIQRILTGTLTDQETWNMSEITMQLDQTNSLIHATILATLYTTMEKFLEQLCIECDFPPEKGKFSLRYLDPPLVGRANLGIMDFVTPGFSFGWLFFFPLISSSIRLIGEKKQGTLARTLSGGIDGGGGGVVRIWEILVAYMITEAGIIFVQATLTFIIMTRGFNVGGNNVSNDTVSMRDVLALIMFILGGFSGLCCGFILALVCSEEIQAALVSIAIFFPNSFISGLVWPLEGMPLTLQYISPFLPFTLPSEALRSLINRSWEFGHPSVWSGFLIVALYTFFYVIIILVVLLRFSYRIYK